MANIVTRIKDFIDFKGIAVSAFEKSIGMSNASFGKSLRNGGAIGSDKLENILSVYPELSVTWLLTGEGEMLQSSPGVPQGASDATIDRLLAKITEQAETIGALKEQIKQLQREKGKDVSDVRTSGVANVG